MDRNSNLKNGLISFLTYAGDLMALNILWIICSIPIVTIGPATASLFSVMLKLVNDEPVSVLTGFFKAFKDNLKQSLVLGAFNIFAIVSLYADVPYIMAISGAFKTLFVAVASIVLLITLVIDTYAYALVVRYNNTLKGHIINAFKLAFTHPVRTIIMWVIYAAPILIILFIPPYVIVYLGWVFLLYAISLPVFCNSIFLSTIFKGINDREEVKPNE